MSEGETQRTFDLAKVGDAGIRAIVDGLEIDGDHVRSATYDATTGVLDVTLTAVDAAGHVEAFVSEMVRTHRLLGRRLLQATQARKLDVQDIDAALAASEGVQVLGAGLVGLRGPLLGAFRYFEQWFRQLARDFDAEENHYPAMIPSEVLAEVGYLAHFPQHVTFCCHLPDNLPILESVASAPRGDAGLPADLGASLNAPRHILTPGVCIPCYRQLRGHRLAPDEVRTLTMQNHVFRYEGSRFRPLARAWDFTVRDIVFFGSDEDLERLRLEVIEQTLGLCRSLDLEVTVELANDPFFFDASRSKAVYQRMGAVKYELLFPLPHRNESMAASSFNLHRDFYTTVYDTRRSDGELAESACMGFGLDRWLYGFLSQKGLDPKGWPEPVAASL